MNEDLYLLYAELSTEGKMLLRQAFAQSPKLLQLIDFLEQHPSAFKTPKVVRFLYGDELHSLDFAKLNNRYYKLRQQLLEWLYLYLKKINQSLSKEEQDLHFARYLSSRNEFSAALELCEALTEYCYKHSLFELLPDVLNLSIYCQQCLTSVPSAVKTEATEEKLWEGIQLAQTLQNLEYHYRCSYRFHTVKDYKKLLQNTRKVIQGHKDQQRFTLIYHYIAFSRGCTLPELVEKSSNALARHLNKVEEIMEEHPLMPLGFELGSTDKLNRCKLYLLKAMFYFQQSNYKKATESLRKQNQLKQRYPEVHFPNSEGEIRNRLSVYIASRDFKLAYQEWESMTAFYKEHDKEERLALVWVEKVNLLFFQYPEVDAKEVQEMDDYIKNYPTDGPFKPLLELGGIWLSYLLKRPIDYQFLERYRPVFEQFHISLELLEEVANVIVSQDIKAEKEVIKKLKRDLKKYRKGQLQLYYQQLLVIIKHNRYFR